MTCHQAVVYLKTAKDNDKEEEKTFREHIDRAIKFFVNLKGESCFPPKANNYFSLLRGFLKALSTQTNTAFLTSRKMKSPLMTAS